MKAREQLLMRDNFVWAWHKVRHFLETADVWYDEFEVPRFESLLERNLNAIRDQFAQGRYSLSSLTPLPQPKKADENGQPQVRQSFWVSVADQVAWVAYVNVIGPLLERAMPNWSYGNRLYRTTWFRDPLNHDHLHLGPFRNAPGFVYRPFRQSWAPFRRRIYLTVRAMAPPRFKKEISLDEPDLATQEQEKNFRPEWQLPYLKPGFWTKASEQPVWASLDLRRFYESVDLNTIRSNTRQYGPEAEEISGNLLDDLLSFRLDLQGWTKEELKAINLSPDQSTYKNIPTGLIVAGFLANVAMLRVDEQVSALVQPAQIAHFRYVDDHVVLAKSFDSLVAWTDQYKGILADAGIGAEVHDGKFQPRELKDWFDDRDDKKRKSRAESACKLDPRFPSPLMTKTLLKVSELAHTNFDLLDEREERAALDDLEHLLLTDFPEQELPAATRVSFAATRIARIASGRFGILVGTASLDRQLHATTGLAERKALRMEVRHLQKERELEQTRERSRVFALLVESVRHFPEKLRLWARVLEFCRASGHTDLRLLVELLATCCSASEVGCRVLRARVLQTFAHQLVLCARAIQSTEEVPWRRTAARRYLLQLPRYIARVRDSIAVPHDYEQASIHLCSAAAGVAEILLAGDYRRVLVPARPMDWAAAVDPVWVWWSERIQRTGSNLNPGEVWQMARPHLQPGDPVVESLLRRYRPIGVRSPNSLRDWLDWLRSRLGKPESWFDPRSSEWTALTIALKLTDLVIERRIGIDIDNIYVPEAWRTNAVVLSWHEWEGVFAGARELMVPPPLFETPRAPAFETVQKVALVLLGLVRRDLRWPADWNSPGPQFSSEYVVRSMISDARASSWTTAILEACLLPRHRETVADLFLRPLIPADDDVAREPITIRNPRQLREYLVKAQSILGQLRMTVHERQSRQLIPMHIGQISREDWSIQADVEFDPEDNDA